MSYSAEADRPTDKITLRLGALRRRLLCGLVPAAQDPATLRECLLLTAVERVVERIV
jgi:hypothetical protein